MRRFDRYARLSWAALILVAGSVAGCASLQDEEQLADDAVFSVLADSARAAERSYDHQTAAAHYQRLVERDPKNIDAAIGLARNLRISGAARNAIRVVRDTIELNGRQSQLVFELGKAQLAAALLDEAQESLVEARKLLPGSWEVRSALGILHDRRSNFEEAETAYRSALVISPNNPVILNNLALSLAQSGRIDEAIPLLEKIVSGERPTIQTKQNLAILYSAKGDMAKAERLVKEDLPPDIAADNLAAFRRLSE